MATDSRTRGGKQRARAKAEALNENPWIKLVLTIAGLAAAAAMLAGLWRLVSDGESADPLPGSGALPETEGPGAPRSVLVTPTGVVPRGVVEVGL